MIALFTALDTEIGYFDSSALITYLDRAIFFAAVIFGIVSAAATKKDALLTDASPVTVWSTFVSIALGFIFAIFGLLFIFLNFAKLSVLVCIVSVGAFFSAAYYVYEGFRPVKSVGLTVKRTLVAMVSGVTLIAVVFVENFDFYVALNNPEKLLVMFLFVIAPLFFIQKLKFGAGSSTPRFYLATAYLTALLGAYISIPGIIANCAGILENPKYLLYYLLALGLAIYALIDLIGRIKLTRLEKSPIAPTEQ